MTEIKQGAAKIAQEFKPDYRIAILSLIGILGFILGCLFLFRSDLFNDKAKSIFHELSYQPRTLADSVISRAKDSLEKEIKTINIMLADSSKKGEATQTTAQLRKAKADSLQLIAKTDQGYIKILSAYKTGIDNLPDSDTLNFNQLNKALHFQITPDTVNNWDHSFATNRDSRYFGRRDTIAYFLKDEKLPFYMGDSTVFETKNATSDVAFITKYPGAGIWLILLLVLCSFCFIAIATSVNLKDKVDDIFKTENIKGLGWFSYYWICIITAIVIAGVALLWKKTFYDDEIVKDLYFIKDLGASMKWIIFMGSVAGAFCLAGFIYTASMANFFSTPILKLRKEIKERSREVEKLKASADPNAQVLLATAEQELVEKESQQDEKEKMFAQLAGIFRGYFNMAAIILSIMVLCTGALFSTINALDFVRLLESDWGYSPARPDFVYLYGGLYSIILLLVYIPARIRFSEVNILEMEPGTTASGHWYDVFKNPFGELKGALVAASPLIASLVQSLFELIFS